MKQTSVFITKAAQICLVMTVIFILPAIMGCIIFLDASMYMKAVHSPSYCAIMTILSLLFTIMYIGSIADKAQGNADNSK
jgi:preprotein translocase subunit SecY